MNFNQDNFNTVPALQPQQDHATAMLNQLVMHHLAFLQSQPQVQGSQTGSGLPAGPGLPMGISPAMLQTEQHQQQHPQALAVGAQNTVWPGLGWPQPQAGMPAIGPSGQQQWMQPQVLANQFLGHGGTPSAAGQALQPNVAHFANAMASAMMPLVREERPTPPASTSYPTARDEQFMIDALKTAKAEGFTPSEALDKLHNVKGHTAAAWKDYFLRHLERLYPRIYPLVAGQTIVGNASPSRVRQPEDDRSSKDKFEKWNGPKEHPKPASSLSRNGHPSSQTLRRNASTRSPAKKRAPPQGSSDDGEADPSESHDSQDDEGESDEDEDTSSEDEQESSNHGRSRQTQHKQKPKPKLQPRANAPTRVTEDDLRAMAQYKAERLHLWDSFPTKQGPWEEFAERKENRKRTRNAWYCVSRDRAHHLEAHLREYLAEHAAGADDAARQCTPPSSDRPQPLQSTSGSRADSESRPYPSLPRKRPAYSTDGTPGDDAGMEKRSRSDW